MRVRDFRPEDLPALKRIHKVLNLDYALPNLSSPLWVVTKVLEVDGEVRAALGAWIQVEFYLLLDKSEWADPKKKLEALKELDKKTVYDLYWLKGIDQACLWLPPGMKRFGKRLEKEFGFTPDREGWVVYSKMLEPK
jgi:hypothetical protein